MNIIRHFYPSNTFIGRVDPVLGWNLAVDFIVEFFQSVGAERAQRLANFETLLAKYQSRTGISVTHIDEHTHAIETRVTKEIY